MFRASPCLYIMFILNCCLINCFAAVTTHFIPVPTKSYILLSIPKGGTHLAMKLLDSVSTKKSIWLGTDIFADDAAIFPPHQFTNADTFFAKFPSHTPRNIASHFNFSDMLQTFASRHPEYTKIIMIRDPRDVCVSTTYYIDRFLVELMGPEAPFSQKLLYVINGVGQLLHNSVFNVQKECACALQWMMDPSVLVCRFEDLCGENGGGTREAQERQIIAIGNALGVTFTQEDLNALCVDIWGGTKTFRKGQIGSWETHFKAIHKETFKKKLGTYLIQMGYEKDNNW
jgi:hypothetical protein